MSSMIRMPLKLRLGKNSGRYDLSQDIYVLSVFVGDYLLVQCTLTSDSTALQCIAFLKEKIELAQSQFFALRYQMKCNDPDRRMMRWVEMEKPLRKQLEKWACKPRQVQLAILFHTPNVFVLNDPIARSLYYNLLKLDVIHGKFVMDIDKYINLAAYSMQVEYGDFNSDLHTMDFLRQLPLLPQHLYRSSQTVDDFLFKILTIYERLTGMSPSYAAFLYIVDAQQCEGYGEEFFAAKDDESTEVLVGYSQDSLFVKRCHSSNLKFRWQDIKDIVAVKRVLFVKCKNDASNSQFTFEDADLARYVAMILNWQWKYALTDAIQHKAVPMSINNLQGAIRTFGNQTAPPLRVYNDNNSFDAVNVPSSTPSSSTSFNRYTPYITRTQASNIQSAHSFQHHVNSAVMNVNRNRAATSASTQHLPATPTTPTLGNNVNNFVTGQYSKSSAVYRPSLNKQDSLAKEPSQFESGRTVLKEINHQKTLGSSPEIHMIGTNNLKNYGNAHLMRRAQSNARGFQQRVNNYSDEKVVLSHALSTPELALKWQSSPDLMANQLAVLRHQISVQNQNQPVPMRIPETEMPQPSSTSSGSSSGRFTNRMSAQLAQSNNMLSGTGIFSQGRVISATRQHGEAIIYPIPTPDQPTTSAEPPSYTRAIGKKPHSPLGDYHLNSLPQSSIASSSSADSYVRQLNEMEDQESEPEPDHSPRLDKISPNSSVPPSEVAIAMNRHLMLNSVARAGTLATQQHQAQITTTDETLTLLKEKLETAQAIDAEFAAIPGKRLSAGVSTSQHPENQPKNRQGNVFPYEDTRVMLTPTKHNTDGYINASNVHIPVGDKTMRYIVCQAPMKPTLEDFWQMIWESGARLIVMLVNPHQLAKTDSSPPYWPTKSKEKMALNDFIIKMQSSTTTKFQTTSVLTVKSISSGERRTVYHLYCADFAVDGVPSSESSFSGFIDAVKSVKRIIENERQSESDSGVFSLFQGKARSRSSNRTNLSDVTNRNRSQSADGGGWKRKLRLATTQSSTPPAPRNVETSRTSDSSDNSHNPDSHQNLEPPTVVHCTDGASESGVYLLVESLIQCIEHNVGVDVPNMLKSLRQQRMYLVRNVNQYRFAYSILKNFLEQSRLI